MKNIILSALAISFILVSCKQNKEVETVNTSTNTPETTTVKVNPNSFSIKEIVTDYLSLKNALTKDDSNATADAGKALAETLGKIDMKKLSGEQMKTYMDIADDVKEHAEHIGGNAGNIAHQREHFVLLSKDINDLIKTFGTEQKLYQDFCPMADEGKGAIWISEVKEIKNPYFGSEMLTCGSVRSEF
jgi:PBP1b-binding outer membrane lipoprotein LpoB